MFRKLAFTIVFVLAIALPANAQTYFGPLASCVQWLPFSSPCYSGTDYIGGTLTQAFSWVKVDKWGAVIVRLKSVYDTAGLAQPPFTLSLYLYDHNTIGGAATSTEYLADVTTDINGNFGGDVGQQVASIAGYHSIGYFVFLTTPSQGTRYQFFSVICGQYSQPNRCAYLN